MIFAAITLDCTVPGHTLSERKLRATHIEVMGGHAYAYASTEDTIPGELSEVIHYAIHEGCQDSGVLLCSADLDEFVWHGQPDGDMRAAAAGHLAFAVEGLREGGDHEESGLLVDYLIAQIARTDLHMPVHLHDSQGVAFACPINSAVGDDAVAAIDRTAAWISATPDHPPSRTEIIDAWHRCWRQCLTYVYG